MLCGYILYAPSQALKLTVNAFCLNLNGSGNSILDETFQVTRAYVHSSLIAHCPLCYLFFRPSLPRMLHTMSLISIGVSWWTQLSWSVIQKKTGSWNTEIWSSTTLWYHEDSLHQQFTPTPGVIVYLSEQRHTETVILLIVVTDFMTGFIPWMEGQSDWELTSMYRTQ